MRMKLEIRSEEIGGFLGWWPFGSGLLGNPPRDVHDPFKIPLISAAIPCHFVLFTAFSTKCLKHLSC